MSRWRDTRDEAERFARDVDSLLDGQPIEENADASYQADLELAELLSRVQFAPDPRFKSRLQSDLRHQLYQIYEGQEVRKMVPMKVFRTLVRPVLVAGLSAVLVIAVVFAVSPAARATAQSAAQELVARFVEVDSPWALFLGGEEQPALPTVTGAPDAEAGDRSASVDSEGESLESQLPALDIQPSRDLVSLEEAQAGLDFQIRVPSVLPEGYTLLGVVPQLEPLADLPGVKPPEGLPKPPEGLPKPSGELPEAPEGLPKAPDALPHAKPQVAILIFGNGADDRLILSEALVTGPALAEEIPLPAGREGVQEVTVNGQPAQYIEGMWTEDGWVSGGHYQLHWQDGGIMFDLVSSTLGLEELLAVAESIE